MSFLALQGLAKTYPDGTEAVRGIDLSCAEGALTVLLGPSGCGKTTTLRMVAGLERPSEGKILLAGEDMAQWPPQRRDVGFVFQFYALYPHLTVRENIAFPLENMGVVARERARRVGEIADRLRLDHLLERRPRHLSGGDQQRVALARAMVRRPKLYLMDEPLGTLDADLRLAMRELIRDQQLADSVTTLYVTHDQEEAMSLADQVVVMEGGAIRQRAAAAEVYARPADLFVAHFIGSPGMNFAQGQLENSVFRSGEFSLSLGNCTSEGNVTLGIRPEFVRLVDEGGLRGEIVLDEYQGACRYVHVQTACGRWVVRTEEAGARALGQRVGLDMRSERLCLFDGKSGKRIE